MEEKSKLRKYFLYNEKYDKPKYYVAFAIVIWIISIVMYFLDIFGPKGNSYIWIAVAGGVTIGTLLKIRRYNNKQNQSSR